MGWLGGSDSNLKEDKKVDNNGSINNVILAEDQSVNIYSIELIVLIGILVVLRIIEFAYFIYRKCQKSMKRKYTTNNCPS